MDENGREKKRKGGRERGRDREVERIERWWKRRTREDMSEGEEVWREGWSDKWKHKSSICWSSHFTRFQLQLHLIWICFSRSPFRHETWRDTSSLHAACFLNNTNMLRSVGHTLCKKADWLNTTSVRQSTNDNSLSCTYERTYPSLFESSRRMEACLQASQSKGHLATTCSAMERAVISRSWGNRMGGTQKLKKQWANQEVPDRQAGSKE